MHDDRGSNNDRSGVLSIVTHPIRFHGKGKKILLTEGDLKIAHQYVLMNFPMVDPYLRQFTTGLRSKYPTFSEEQINAIVKEDFQKYFQILVI